MTGFHSLSDATGRGAKRAQLPVLLLLALFLVGASARPVLASCDLIPGTTRQFKGTLGSIDRPFARPGDWVSLRLSPACDGDSPGFPLAVEDLVVTVVFTPPSGQRNIAVIAADCASRVGQRTECRARPDLDLAFCTQSTSDLQLTTDNGQPVVRFRFPRADTGFYCEQEPICEVGPSVILSGPAKIAVTHANDAALPCALAASTCASHPGLIACIDTLYSLDGTCGESIEPTFPHFTALPDPNRYSDLCTDPSPPCTGSAPYLQFTTDVAGNILLPMDWRGVLPGQGIPIARLLRGSSVVEAFPGSGQPVRIPGNGFLRSFSTNGGLLPPVFDPHTDPSAAAETTLFGSADAPETILRIARRSPNFTRCYGGANDGLPCIEATDCPEGSCASSTCTSLIGQGEQIVCQGDGLCFGECGPSLFEFRSRYTDGVGPVLIDRTTGGAGVCESSGSTCVSDGDCPGSACVAFRFQAQQPVPLEGLIQSKLVNAFVMEEALQGLDLNGDGDRTDHVVQLADRRTGQGQSIGAVGTGRAVARIYQDTTSYPALAVHDDILAFLEPEPTQGGVDANGNGSIFETLLRIFRLGGGALSPSPLRAVDAAPLIDGRSLAIAGGKVLVRTSETAMAAKERVRVSVSSTGERGNGHSYAAAVSGNGRWVAFESLASNLVPGDANNYCSEHGRSPGGSFNCADIFVHDLLAATTVRVSVDANGNEGDSASRFPSISHDGRFVSFMSFASNLVAGDGNDMSDVFVHDRDYDGNGIYDEPGVGRTNTSLVSVRSDDTTILADSFSAAKAMSADGRYVLMTSSGALDPADDNGLDDLYLRDRDLDGNGIFDEPGAGRGQTILVSVPAAGGLRSTPSAVGISGPSLSASGRFVVFATDAPELTGDPVGMRTSVLLRDVRDGVTEIASLSHEGMQANGPSTDPVVSDDGRYVHFTSAATNLVPGDSNGALDVFIRDRLHGITTRASIGSNLAQFPLYSERPAISEDGRFVAFRGLVPGAGFWRLQMLIHDRFTRLTVPVYVGALLLSATEGEWEDASGRAALSAAGGTAAFSTAKRTIIGQQWDPITGCDFDFDDGVERDDQPCSDVYAYRLNPDDPLAADFTGDADVADTLLEAVDASSGAVTSLCPAGAVSADDANVVFLRPEAAGPTPLLAHCPAGSALHRGNPVLNDDGDANDEVVHLWRGAANVDNLHCAATAVALSSTHVAALVPEAGQGDGPLNGDGDIEDTVVRVYRLTDATPSACDEWRNAGTHAGVASAADLLALSGSIAVFLTPEAAHGSDLNGDGDQDDRVLQTFDAATGAFYNSGRAAGEFVVGDGSLVAFRTREAAQGNADLNGDGDSADDVLHVLDLSANQIFNTGQAVIPCRLEACDARMPYRVLYDTVTFLTLEDQQGEDLNDNGSLSDLILQTFNVRRAQAQGFAPLVSNMSRASRFARASRGNGAAASPLIVLGIVSAGVCTNSGEACASNGDCGGGACFVPPGGCLEDLGTACDPESSGACGGDQFCQPTLGSPGSGTCVMVQESCRSDADCTAPATCNDNGQFFQRLVNPLARQDGGGEVFTSTGQCVEATTTACMADTDCATGTFCGSTHFCARSQGYCLTDDHCPGSAFCAKRLVVASAPDSDGDELPDPFDNCPEAANILQADADGNGVGDACTFPTCGNGVIESRETCDDGNTISGDCCSSDCQFDSGSGDGPIPACSGDCNDNGAVTIGEVQLCINLFLGRARCTLDPQQPSCWQADADGDGGVTIGEVQQCVNHHLGTCPALTGD